MPSYRLVNVADEFADANKSAVLLAKSGSEVLPYRLYKRRDTTVAEAIGEFIGFGVPESSGLADLVYAQDDDLSIEEIERRVGRLIEQKNPALYAAADFIYDWTMEVANAEFGIRYVDDDGW